MAKNDTEVIVQISADVKDLKQGLQETRQMIEQESRKWDSAIDQSSQHMSNSFAKALDINRLKDWGIQAAKAMIDFGMQCVNAASDLEEVQNVVDVTFGDSASQIDAWAKTAINQFGLTETKAKQFASTMGAMMKSSGLAGNEIVSMSENLAGLAADMASFYNLDFDTAFQKIRSGISGETEPLKQLGINMSQANLQAFALEKGITKALDKMSQGEMVMLRYQYLMQATADAQGDFARTSDGFANSQRLLSANLEAIQTKLGQAFIPILAGATTAVNDFLTEMVKERPKTVLDDFADIDLKTEEKLAQLQETADKADVLIDTLKGIALPDEADNIGKRLSAIADGANKLNSSSTGTWQAVLGSLTSINGLENIFTANAGDGVKSLAEALAGDAPDKEKSEAWQTLISTLSENAEGLTKLTGKSAEETKAWLESIADAASKIEPGDADAWDKLLGTLAGGLGGGENSEEFVQGIAANLLALGSESETAKNGLLALGFSTDEIETKQAEWLETCKRLVQTIPGLSSVIDVNTGRVNGGTVAVEEYVKQWQDAQTAMIMMDAIAQKQSALVTEYSFLPKLKVNMDQAKQAVEQARKELEEQGVQFNEFDMAIANGKNNALVAEYTDLMDKAIEAEDEYNRHKVDYDKAKNGLQQEADAVYQVYGNMVDLTGAAGDAGKAMEEAFTQEQITKATEAITNMKDATKALKDYTDQVFNSTKKSLESTLGGFNRMVDPFEQARKKVVDLKTQLNDFDGKASEKNKLKVLLTDAENAIPTIQNLNEALQSQLNFLNDYYDNIAKMKAAGYSDDVIAMVSDGSAQSAAYAKALAEAGANDPRVAEINKKVQDIQQKTTELTGTLTENKLKVDEKAQELTDTWAVAVANLDQYIGAKENTTKTVEGIIEALGEGKEKVHSEVQSIIDMLTDLSNASYTIPNVNLTNFGTGGGNGLTVNVHSVTTLDGRTLSNSVSQHQADQLNQMNRSGGVLTE